MPVPDKMKTTIIRGPLIYTQNEVSCGFFYYQNASRDMGQVSDQTRLIKYIKTSETPL